jgi:Ni,Fe-hydrogenase maturation factor
VVIACEPAAVEEMGLGLSESVRAAVDRAADLALKTVADLRVETG